MNTSKTRKKGALEKRFPDPRIRLTLILCLSMLAILCSRLSYLVPLFLLSLGLFLLEKNRTVRISGKRLRQFFVFFVILAVLQSIFNQKGAVLLQLAGIPVVTVGGLVLGASFLCRMLIIMLSGVLISAEDPRRTVQGLIEWKMPYELAFLIAVAMRFIPIFTEEIHSSITAIQLRGVELEKIPLSMRIKLYTYLLLPVMGNTIIRAKEMALAMEMRAFRAYAKRTSYIRLSFGAADYAALAFMLAGTVGVLALYFTS